MNVVAGYKFALFREYLDSVTTSFANVDQPIHRNVDAVKCRRELLLIRRWTRPPVIWRRGIVADRGERLPLTSPATLEAPVVAVHQYALLLDQIDLPGILIECELEDATLKDVGLLVIFPVRLALRERWRPMAEVPKELAVASEFLDAVSPASRGKPDVALSIHKDGMLVGFRPTGCIPGTSPSLEHVAFCVEFHDRRRCDTAIG